MIPGSNKILAALVLTILLLLISQPGFGSAAIRELEGCYRRGTHTPVTD
jgi:hypothetical protein